MLAALSCQTASVNDRGQRLHDARLYLVCDERPSTFLECALTGGVDIVQVRIKDAGDDERIVAAARRYRPLCERFGALLIVNDRPDLVAAAGADGVHVGQDDVAVDDARAVVGADALVGVSTHSPAQIDAAADAAVDYIGVGPVHATPTKPGRPAVGLQLVAYAAEHATVPFFAIGGIDEQCVAEVSRAGGRRVAVVRALIDAADPEGMARRLRAGLEEVSLGAA
jgi:thiamine-phosphate pyrophosphorylase